MNRSLSHIQAIAFAIMGFTLWVLTDSCIKLATDVEIPPQEVAGILGLVGMITLLLKAQRQGGIKTLQPHKLRNQMPSAFLSLGINLLNVVALKHLSFTLFYIAVFTAPMVVATLAALFLREYLTHKKIIAILAGFAGVIIAINPFQDAISGTIHGDWIGYTSATGAVLCFATNMILLRRVTQSETPDSLGFMQSSMQTLGCGIIMCFSHVPLAWTILLLLCGAGVLNIMGNLCNMIASKHTTAATVAQFHYTQLISGALIGYLIWHEIPTLPLIAGSVIIIASGIYIANHMRKAKIDPTIKPS